MAQKDTTKKQTSSLADFDLMDEDFGEFEDKDTSSKIKTVIGNLTDDKIDDEEEEGSTSIEETDAKGKPKVKADQQEEIKDTDFDFGGVKPKPKGTTPVAPKKAVKKEEEEEENEEEEDTTKSKKTGKVVSKETKDAEVEEVDDNENVEEEDDNPEEDKAFFTSLAKEFKENGYFEGIEIDEKTEVDEESFYALLENDFEERLDEAIEDYAKDFDEDGKAYLKWKKNGGKTSDFLNYYLSPIDLESFDAKNKTQVSDILRYYITTVEQLDGEELDDRLAYLKDSGKEAVTAEKWYNKLKEQDDKRKETLNETIKQQAEKTKERIIEFNTGIKEALEKTDKFKGFPITKADKRELGSYITKPTIKIGKNKFAPEMQVAISKILNPKTETDKKKLIVLAKLLKNDFDVSDLAIETQTKVVRKAKESITRFNRGDKKATSGSSGKGSRLADLIDA